MPRLPIPGGDNGDWGDILNAFLDVSLNTDGSLANNTVGTNQLQSGAVTNEKLDNPTQAAIALANSAVPSSQLGAADGVAQLDSNSTLKTSQLPSSVVTVSSGTPEDGQFAQFTGDGSAVIPVAAPGGAINWAIVSLAQPLLNVAQQWWTAAPGDLTITQQSADDFSVVEDPNYPGQAALATAGGGRFQAGVYLDVGATTLDGSSSAPRYEYFFLQVGSSNNADPNTAVAQFGIDAWSPAPNPGITGTWASTIGYSLPGETALFGMGAGFVGAIGTDVQAAVAQPVVVWQV